MNIQLCEKCGTHSKQGEDKIKTLIVTLRQINKASKADDAEPMTKSIEVCQPCINGISNQISELFEPANLDIKVRTSMLARPGVRDM